MIDKIAPRPIAGNTNWSLACGRCGGRFDPGPFVFGCPACARQGEIGTLETLVQADRRPRGSHVPAAPRDLRRYLDVLPGGDSDGWISLGEGGTPLLRSRVVGPALGLTNLYFKTKR